MQCSGANGAKLSVFALVTVILPTMPAFAAAPQRERTAAAVMAVEHEWLSALQRGDAKTLARVLGREFIDSDFQGEAITRSRYLARFARPAARHAPCSRRTFGDTVVRFVAGGNVAIVTGIVITRLMAACTGTGVSSNPDAIRRSRFTDVFVWRNARWQAVTGQETHFTLATE